MADAPSIQHALNEVKKAIGAVGKDSRNQAQNFNFRGVDAVVNAAAPHLNAHGIITVPRVLEYSYDTVEIGAKRTPMAHVLLKAEYAFYGPAGDYLYATVIAESMDSGDKAVAKAMSVAYRIVLLQVLNLPTDEPDPDESSFERSAQNATITKTANSAITVKSAKNATPEEYAKIGKSAKTVGDLRTVWQDAGGAGHLKTEIAHPDTGEKIALEAYLQLRSDEITHSKSSAVAANGAGGGGAK